MKNGTTNGSASGGSASGGSASGGSASGNGMPDYEVIIIGAGVAGIYQMYRLAERGVHATVLEMGSDLGGTWFWNRYPGCRFDSESYTYGYSFSDELLEEWHWQERFSGQPENLRYLNYVADKFDLRKHMQFNCPVESAHYDEDDNIWRLHLGDGRDLSCRFLLTALGLLSAPTYPRVEGVNADGTDVFKGQSFHTYHWPPEPVELDGKRVAVIGTGATGVQAIAAIGEKADHLTVFQRRPNWCAPLHNSEISDEEMAGIRARYDEIFATCARTPGGFEHEPDRRGFYNVAPEERRAMWEKLYGEPGFGIWMANFREIFFDEEANAELSAFIGHKIRQRVDDPVIAEKLVPKDHGFGVQRVPLETHYYETYNRPNVQLVDLQETPIERITPTGVQTTEHEYEFDIIVYATGFRRHHRLVRPHRHPRLGRGEAARQVERRTCHLPGPDGQRVPEPADDRRPAERLSVHELSTRDRDRRGLGDRAPRLHLGERLHPLRGRPRRRAGVDQPRRRDVQHDADAQGPGLVHGVQLERRRPREGHDPLSRLQRRCSEIQAPHR